MGHFQNTFVVLICQQPLFYQQSVAHFSEFSPLFWRVINLTASCKSFFCLIRKARWPVCFVGQACFPKLSFGLFTELIISFESDHTPLPVTKTVLEKSLKYIHDHRNNKINTIHSKHLIFYNCDVSANAPRPHCAADVHPPIKEHFCSQASSSWRC